MWGAIVILLASAAVPEGSAKRLGEVRGLIKARGASEALWSLFADDKRWDQLLDDIATGTSEWLAVAAELHPVSDAHASESLAIALQEALPRNPAGVLDLVAARSFSAPEACGNYGFGQIEDERPASVILQLVDRRIDAVARLANGSLTSARDACLKELRSLRAGLE